MIAFNVVLLGIVFIALLSLFLQLDTLRSDVTLLRFTLERPMCALESLEVRTQQEVTSGRAAIVSDGTPAGTAVYVGGQILEGIVKVEWRASGRRPRKVVATITLRDVPVDLVADLAVSDLRAAKEPECAQDDD